MSSMPQASDELRGKIDGYFHHGTDMAQPLAFLIGGGWKDFHGVLRSPDRKITDQEWDCVDFLIDEWAFGYETTRGHWR